MREQKFVQFKVDKVSKQEVIEIHESTSTEDLSTAFHSKITRTITHAEAVHAFHVLREQASDVPEMSIDEINAEISETRTHKLEQNDLHITRRLPQ